MQSMMAKMGMKIKEAGILKWKKWRKYKTKTRSRRKRRRRRKKKDQGKSRNKHRRLSL